MTAQTLSQIGKTVNSILAEIQDMTNELDTSEVFIRDTLTYFFDEYIDSEEEDIAVLICMFYQARKYVTYIETVHDYLNRAIEKATKAHKELSKVYYELKS